MGAFLGTYFVTKWALLGALGIAAPILIWLINRFRTQVVEWAAIEFLRRAVQKARRRMRIEEILLLIIRCLIIILLAIVFARPKGVTKTVAEDEEVTRNFVILLDASYSMGYKMGSTKEDLVFNKAKDEARKIIQSLGHKDRLILDIYTGGVHQLQTEPRAMDEKGKPEALRSLEDPDFAVSAEAGDGADLFRSLPQVLQKFDGANGKKTQKTVFILFDSQRSLFFKKNKLRDSKLLQQSADEIGKNFGEIKFVDCSNDKTFNVSVLSAKTRNPVIGVGFDCYFEVLIKNHNPTEVSVDVDYYIDDLKRPVKSVSALTLKPNEVRPLYDFKYKFEKAGPHRFQVKFRSDNLTIDNERSLIVNAREAVKTLVINGSPNASQKVEDEVHYLRGALEPNGPKNDLLRPEYVNPGALVDIDLEGYDVVFLANVETLTDLAVSRLKTYANDGGTVIFTLGDQVNKSFYNQKLYAKGKGLFPVPLDDIDGRADTATSTERAREWELEIVDTNYPPLKMWTEKEMVKWLKYPSFYRIFQIDREAAKTAKFRSLADFIPRALADDSVEDKENRGQAGPALVEKNYGRGTCLAFLSTVDADWNRAPAFDVFYVLFWREILLHLSLTREPKRHFAVGEVFEELLSQKEYSPEVRITRPDGQPTIQSPQALKDNTKQFRLRFDNTQLPGIYTVDFGPTAQKKPIYFAVNIDSREGDLTTFDTKNLDKALTGVKIEDIGADSMDKWLAENSGEGSIDEYWRYFLYAAIALLVLESVLAMLFGRRRQ